MIAGAPTALSDYEVTLRMEALCYNGEADGIKQPCKRALIYLNHDCFYTN